MNRLSYVGDLLLVVCQNRKNFKLLTAYLRTQGWHTYLDPDTLYTQIIEKFSLSDEDIFIILKRK